MNEVQTYRIPAVNYPQLLLEVEKLNKRAIKLQTTPILLSILETVTEKKRNEVIGFDYQETFHICTVTGQAPKLAGWTFVAVVEPVANGENLIREVPGQRCPHEYRSTKMSCDHCGEYRKRNAIFVLRHENGEHKTVGRNCLADFLGHEHPEALLAAAEYLMVFNRTMGEAGEDGWGFRSGPMLVPTTEFVSVTSVVIRKLGWLPKYKAGEFDRCTSDIVWDVCTRPNDKYVAQLIREKELFAQESDIEEAEQAVAWAASFDPKKESSTYLYDLGVCCRQNFVDVKRRGFVASVIAAHRRHLSLVQTASSPHGAYASKHVGEIDKRQVFEDLVITHADPYMWGVYSKTKIKFVDKTGNILVWRATGCPEWAKVGLTVSVKGTVKKHLNSAGILETEMNIVKPMLDIISK